MFYDTVIEPERNSLFDSLRVRRNERCSACTIIYNIKTISKLSTYLKYIQQDNQWNYSDYRDRVVPGVCYQ